MIDIIYEKFISALRSTDFSGEIRTDYAARLSVATDNSIYQVIPQAVLFPKNTKDISCILQLKQKEIKFSARGGGTGANGQSLSAGIIIYCSKYMREILEINVEERFARVQPGVVLDQLNQALKPFGLYFAPDISTSNRATIGGMINTDACGNGSKILGRTSDHVLDLTCVMYDGKIFQTQSNVMEKKLIDILSPHQALIKEKFFNAPRTLCGYNLEKAYQNTLNLNYLLCGSEGTLAIVSECKLKLSPIPKFKKLLVINYRNFEDALCAREITSDIKPLVIETIDEKLLNLAREDNIYFYIKEFIRDANSINLVEFVGNDLDEINQQVSILCKNIEGSSHATGFYLAKNDEEIALLWELRKKSVGLISKLQDHTRRPIPFIEDTAVPPEKLADYIAEFKQLLDKHQLVYGMYGHIDAGCIHVRPALDTKIPHDEKLVRDISDEVVLLVKKYGGVIWGEHGKGYRSEYGPTFFGETLYHVLRQIKTLFDPYNQLNPGKIATPLDSTETIVKVSGPMRGHFDKEISDNWRKEYESALACNGNGACFNFSTNDVMCPSYKVTQDRIHSPKGRATIIREWIRQLSTSSKPPVKDFAHEVYAALSGCLSCKACKNQCPLSVDVSDFKSKFLSEYHHRYSRKFRDYLIANMEIIAKWQGKLPRLFNFLTHNPLSRILFEKCFKLVDLPKLDDLRIEKFKSPVDSSVILLQDVFTSFYDKKVLISSYQFLTSLGFSVYVAPFFPNGKPYHVMGFLKRFNQLAKENINYLRKLSDLNVPLIGLEPSITLTYRDEYQKVLGDEKPGFDVLLLQEFLIKHLDRLQKKSNENPYFLLSHCTEKTMHIETEKEWKNIFSSRGLTLIPLQVGCCGMAGSYGHEKEHVNNSRALFNMDWLRYVKENPDAEKYLLATGYSCRSQVKRMYGISLQHPLEVLI